MKKGILYIIFTIFFFFFSMNIVNADTCANIQEKIDNYKIYNDELSAIDCTDTSNSSNVSICNDINVRKNIVITELMKLNEKNAICSDKQDEVDAIIEENQGKCGKIFDDSFSDFVNGFMVFFYILGPILLIFFGSLDFAKATVSANQDALKKAWKTFSKRLVATILLFLTPTIVNFIISFNVSDKYLSGNAYSCDYEYLVYTKKYNIKYVPKNNSSTTGISGNGDIIEAAEKLHSKYEQEKWTYGASFSNDIAKATNDPFHRTVCATFVASVLYASGAIPEDVINKYAYQVAHESVEGAHDGVEGILIDNGWTKITDYDKLEAGDIVFMPGHVQIFAGRDSSGNYLWYNAGSKEAIQRENPYTQGDAYSRSRFESARRKP